MFSRLRSGFKGVSSTGSRFCWGNAVAWDRMFATNRDRSDPNGSNGSKPGGSALCWTVAYSHEG